MKRLVVLCAFLVVACGNAGVAQPETVALAFKSGDTFKYKFESHTNQNVAMGAMTMPIKVDVSADEAVKVNSVDSTGIADLTVTMTNVKVTTTTNGVTNTTTIASETSQLKIGKDGRPVSMNGAQISGDNPFGAFAAMGGSFFISAVMPDGKVNKGDKWNKTYDQNSADGSTKVHITSTSTYLGQQNGQQGVKTQSDGTFNATFDFSKKASGQTGSSTLPIGNIKGMTMTGTLTSDVTSWIDPNTHRIIRTNSQATDKGTIEFQQPADGSATQQLPITGPIQVDGKATTDLKPA